MNLYQRQIPPRYRTRQKDSIDVEKIQEKKPATIKLTLVNAIIAGAIGLFLLSLGYIGNDLKKSYVDLGQVKTDITKIQGSIETIDSKLVTIDASLTELTKIHLKN